MKQVAASVVIAAVLFTFYSMTLRNYMAQTAMTMKSNNFEDTCSNDSPQCYYLKKIQTIKAPICLTKAFNSEIIFGVNGCHNINLNNCVTVPLDDEWTFWSHPYTWVVPIKVTVCY